MDDLTSYIELNAYPGTAVSLTVLRGGGTFEVPVTLGAYG
jgi:S1-C subfamily serine protease